MTVAWFPATMTVAWLRLGISCRLRIPQAHQFSVDEGAIWQIDVAEQTVISVSFRYIFDQDHFLTGNQVGIGIGCFLKEGLAAFRRIHSDVAYPVGLPLDFHINRIAIDDMGDDGRFQKQRRVRAEPTPLSG